MRIAFKGSSSLQGWSKSLPGTFTLRTLQRVSWGLVGVLAMLLWAPVTYAQSGPLSAQVMRIFSRQNTWYASSSNDLTSSLFLRIPNSTALPATCTEGDIYQDTDATGELNLCTSTNTWSAVGSGIVSGTTTCTGGANDGILFNSAGTVNCGVAAFKYDASTTPPTFTFNTTLASAPAAPASVGTTPGTTPTASAITGATGGATSIATTGTAGAGQAVTIVGGTGGVTTATATAGTGGAGGVFGAGGGVGGAATFAATGTNTGGAGGVSRLGFTAAGAGVSGGVASGGDTANVGGAGGGTNVRSGNGGAATAAGTASATGGNAGATQLFGGAGGAASGATSATNTGGNGASINIGASVSSTSVGGAASGSTTQNTGGSGGTLNAYAGNGGAANTATAGINTAGGGGQTTIRGGDGGAAENGATNNGGNGGAVSITGGVGGTGASNPGNGGNISIAAGAGNTAGTTAISAGNGSGTDIVGGTLTLSAGFSTGAGAPAEIALVTTDIGSTGTTLQTSATKAKITTSGLQNTVGDAFKTADETNATTTMDNIDGLSITVAAGRKYSFTLKLFVSDDVAADGAKFDFDGGAATATNFRAHCTLFDAGLLLSTQATALATDFAAATITGASLFECYGSFEPSAAGTFIPRFAQNAHTTGTLTVFRGSHLRVADMP